MVYQFKHIPVRTTHGLSIQKKELVDLYKHLVANPEAIKSFASVPVSRHDLIRPTLRLLISVLTFLHAETYIVCRSGLREGIIFERAQKLAS
jgi:exopolyphosphatase/pppGpp-phosphohydrolase